MGCCLSRTTSSPNPNPKNADRRPPPPQEEETVKEVLTETPIVAAALDEKPLRKTGAAEKFEAKVAGEKKSMMIGEDVEKKRIEQGVEIQSVDVDVSEITVATENRSEAEAAAAAAAVSVSECVFAATAGGGEEVVSKSRDRERAEAVISRNQRSTDQSQVTRRRPHSGELTTFHGPKEKRVRSPAKRAVPSPEKNNHVAPRAVRGRSQSPATSKQRNAVNGGPAKIRRDAGERSGGRSRSPGRNALKNSCNRNGPVSEANGGEVTKRGTSGTDGKPDVNEDPTLAADDESLDNPLVSLECFIFL